MITCLPTGTQFIPLYLSRVSCGFPSPAENDMDLPLSLDQHLIRNPASTFFVKASGSSMINAGISDQDLLLVDRSLRPEPNQIILAVLDGEFTIKRLVYRHDHVELVAENPDYPNIRLTEAMDFMVWGVVIYVVHDLRDPTRSVSL